MKKEVFVRQQLRNRFRLKLLKKSHDRKAEVKTEPLYVNIRCLRVSL